MMDIRSFMSQMFTTGTVPCTVLGIVIGAVFAILCLTIGVGKALVIGVFCLVGAFAGGVKDKKAFIRNIILFFHRDNSDY